ncbi:hypothetical protein C7S16_2612 [Burkholderia thailandensis]|uniref:Uncharacterized protein n=1 Tax=Burkholderia thailandensis TaxID=57975 RepID=A0AAW9D206_BURTH|nr:hypothetical protein [Burkholderia thailandensis]MDW9256066.1 hypothetical protein [Burkholderia thailandensis]
MRRVARLGPSAEPHPAKQMKKPRADWISRGSMAVIDEAEHVRRRSVL